MSLPYVRCPSCNKVIIDAIMQLFADMEVLNNNPKLSDEEKVLERQKLINNSGLKRICCRERLMGFRPNIGIIK